MSEIKVKPLASLAAKPKLISIMIDDEATLAANDGYALEFFTWDRQPMDVFARMVNFDQSNPTAMIELACAIILDADGKRIIDDGTTLRNQVLSAAIAKVVETLGN